ncbi:MAG: hypothetical protein Q8R02_14775 [Hyphomonadaceae bacterium]|nr:hypothetical protein [Hyphomonadaceae bacterium]
MPLQRLRAIPPVMEWIVTSVVIGAGVLLTGFAAWKSGQPKKDSLRARWISWPLVTLVAGAVLIMGVVHAMNLAGLHTGGGMLGGPARP